MTHEAGKGDKQRPTDQQKFAENYDKIFGGGKHYKEGSLEKQVLDDIVKSIDQQVEIAMITGASNGSK